MLSNEIKELEHENFTLKNALQELEEKMEKNEVLKPKSCQYCKNYMQHYIKTKQSGGTDFTPIYYGHCICNVPIYKGRKKNPKPDETCPYFEIGTHEMWTASGGVIAKVTGGENGKD